MQLSNGQLETVSHHREWYDRHFAHDRRARWERQLEDQPETAICEALVRETLERHVEIVCPYEDLSTGGPDFKCFQNEKNNQRHFYVETTCLTIEAVSKATGLSADHVGPAYYRLLTKQFWNACRNKSKQLRGLDAPGLLAITTLHRRAGNCFGEKAVKLILTSDTRIAQNMDSETGAPVGGIYLSSDMSKSAFQRPSPDVPWPLEDASRSVSGILLCASAGDGPWPLVGALHPNAVRPFDPFLLRGVPLFGVQEKSGAMNVIQVGE